MNESMMRTLSTSIDPTTTESEHKETEYIWNEEKILTLITETYEGLQSMDLKTSEKCAWFYKVFKDVYDNEGVEVI